MLKKACKMTYFIFYCSAFALEQLPPEIISQAEQGEGDALIKLIAYLTKNNQYSEAQEHYFRLLIRARQDTLCCNYTSLNSTPDLIKAQLKSYFRNPDGIKVFLDTQQSISAMEKAVAWAEKLTQEKKLPTPYWIMQFGKQPENSGKTLFIDSREWAEKRWFVIDGYKKLISYKKNNQ